ncbi:hypothetical protein BJ166DRAFT_365562 [Pestalotiopsis sp. NC0098]|nr:hypothetical protein BJ166DRAFT_365562 [Pestalotiopsis sp. NC0098]
METSSSPPPRQKPQSRACEACRAAKTRCQIGPQPNICKRCSDFKRECIFRTGPRTRRAKVAKGEAELPPPPGPSKTFSIDFTMPADEEPVDSIDELRRQHERFIDDLIPSSEEEEDNVPAMSPSAGPVFDFNSLPTPTSTASLRTRPMVNLGIKPQFNLDSAEKLFQMFRSMLPSCPCVMLDECTDVRCMARDSPFVLLAILAATSCSTSLQGHSLYDEEFRKVLGLKFVTGGERTLDLLQGILVYCAWYPFHLRPKHRQALQYLKMATEITSDLELDQEETFADRLEGGLNLEDLACMRAFVSCYYLVTTFSNSFHRTAVFPYTAWLAKCCDLLEQQSNIEQDHILVWLVRYHHISDELTTLQKSYKKPGSQSEPHRLLIHRGLESQLREWQNRIPTNIAMMPSIMMSSLFDDMHLVAAPLMAALRPKANDGAPPLDPKRLLLAVQAARAFFDFATALPPDALAQLSSADRSHLIIAVIVGYRLSFPLDACPAFDAAQARLILNFGDYLERLCRDPAEGGQQPAVKKRTDICTAFRVVLRALKAKYDKKVAAAMAKEEIRRKAQECPMFDGSLDDYISLWDGHGAPIGGASYPTSQSSSSGVLTDAIIEPAPSLDQGKPTEFHDLWATMTLGWGTGDLPDLNMGDPQLDYGSFE